LKASIARDLGKALAPKEIVFVGDIPKTRNAKVMRRIVRAAYLGENLGDTSALENPASLGQDQAGGEVTLIMQGPLLLDQINAAGRAGHAGG
jgi:acetyl-CoA synthetase